MAKAIKQEIKLSLRYLFWMRGLDTFLCARTLRNYFNIPKDKTKIVGVLSNKPMAQGYKLICKGGVILHVNGKSFHPFTTYDFDILVRMFIRKHGVCYGRIEWDE